jgi:hypothetical protein
MKEPTKKIYKAITNYINNDVGLNKEDIHAYIDQRLNEFTQQYTDQRMGNIDKLVADRVNWHVKNGFSKEYIDGFRHASFENTVKEEIRKAVIDIVDAKMKEILKL